MAVALFANAASNAILTRFKPLPVEPSLDKLLFYRYKIRISKGYPLAIV